MIRKANTDTELLAAARLGAPKGLGGFLRIHSYSGEFDHILGLDEVLLSAPDSAQGAAAGKSLRLKVRARERGDWGAGLAFEGYDTPEAARKLTGMEILVPRNAASPLKVDEYYIHDLIGLKVICSGREVAVVKGILEGGADPLLEMHPISGGPAVLVPFRKLFVGDVDLEAGTLDLLAGWLLE